MRPIALSPRLLALARQVPQGVRFADVGTDHARLPVWLLEHGVIDHAIATDLREGPLERARETARRHELTDRISFRLGDGLAPLERGEADLCAIAGMGGGDHRRHSGRRTLGGGGEDPVPAPAHVLHPGATGLAVAERLSH